MPDHSDISIFMGDQYENSTFCSQLYKQSLDFELNSTFSSFAIDLRKFKRLFIFCFFFTHLTVNVKYFFPNSGKKVLKCTVLL